MGKHVSIPHRPDTNDPDAWRTYWGVRGWTWRTEPEIGEERQRYLAERRAIKPDIEKGIYPFKDIKLSRADVEWLLATHENGRGPVDWSDKSQREREGLDLRGSMLQQENLQYLPLASLRAGLDWNEELDLTVDQMNQAAIHLEQSHLRNAHLENANLCFAHLENAHLSNIHFEEANMVGVRLFGATLINACLQKADLSEAHCEGAYLFKADLRKANLQQVFFDAASNLTECQFDTWVMLADLHWGDVNLAVVDWSKIDQLGEEHTAKKSKQIEDYLTALRANRQCSIILRDQGLNEEADQFAYRAQKLQRIVLRREKKFWQYIFSLFLDTLAGYGYRPGRSVLWYLATIISFALAYHFLGGLSLYPPDAFVFSIMSFHGRGFFPALSQETNLHNPLVMLAAAEAIIGLLIEISFIATFTQRFFGR